MCMYLIAVAIEKRHYVPRFSFSLHLQLDYKTILEDPEN
jgi:hypothetical protein